MVCFWNFYPTKYISPFLPKAALWKKTFFRYFLSSAHVKVGNKKDRTKKKHSLLYVIQSEQLFITILLLFFWDVKLSKGVVHSEISLTFSLVYVISGIIIPFFCRLPLFTSSIYQGELFPPNKISHKFSLVLN